MVIRLRRVVRSHTARALGALLLAYAVLLPVYGPLIDPAFAARLPFHTHVYPEGVAVPHSHSYDRSSGLPSADDLGIAITFDYESALGLAVALLAVGALLTIPALRATPVPLPVRQWHGIHPILDPPPPRPNGLTA